MAYKNKNEELEYYRKRAVEKKAHLDILRSVPCLDCKNTYLPCQMEFDHVPERGEKRFGIANGGNYCLTSKLFLDELAKCDIVCANCHRLRTYNRGQWNVEKKTKK